MAAVALAKSGGRVAIATDAIIWQTQRILRVTDGNNDLYGSEMNLTCKLGEDLARRGEFLLTQAAFQEVQHHPGVWKSLDLSIFGVDLAAHRIRSFFSNFPFS